MKKVCLVMFSLIMVLLFSGCCLSHEWVEADCTTPKTCSKCEKTEGESLGHQWKEATCTDPKTCTSCGMTEGETLEHAFGKEEIQNPDYVKATATFVRTCASCGERTERSGELEKIHDGKVFLMTPEEFSDRFTNMLMDMQHLVGDDSYFSFIDTETTAGNLKMYMCRRNAYGTITIVGEFEMMAYGCRDSLLPEQYTESAIFQKVHGTVRGEDNRRLAMLAFERTVEPLHDERAAINITSNWDIVTNSDGVSFVATKDFVMEIDPKGGTTYGLSVKVR